MNRPVWYEPHPVTTERKAELRARGFQIVDAIFQPKDYQNPGTEPVETKPAKRGKKGAP